MSSDKNVESVADFYKGKTVFITGGTGFLGKAFIEKLLFSCPGIETIYVLLRDKKSVPAEERIKDLINDPIFVKLKIDRPHVLNKILPISGDITLPNLGINCTDENRLIEEVSIIIHSAATVKFNEPLKVAWKNNFEGTKSLLDLGKRMKKLDVFIHISTAFTNTNRDVVEEILYPPPAEIDEVYLRLEEELTDEETRLMLNGRPNTYTFTKAITEHLVAKYCSTIPAIIIRPSIVSAAKVHPVEGWLDNWYGATGLTTLSAKGVNWAVYGNYANIIDLIPVDYVANTVIASAAMTKRLNEVIIYNCCSSGCNPIRLGKLVRTFRAETIKHDKSFLLQIPTLITPWPWLITIVTFLFQIIPALFGDLWRVLLRKGPRYMKLQALTIQTRKSLDYFTSHFSIMKTDRLRRLHASLSLEDRLMFPCDPADIDWDKYLPHYCWGVRKFLGKKK